MGEPTEGAYSTVRKYLGLCGAVKSGAKARVSKILNTLAPNGARLIKKELSTVRKYSTVRTGRTLQGSPLLINKTVS